MRKTKTIEVVVKVRCPSWLPAAAARREIKTLINEQTHFGHRRSQHEFETEIDADNFRAVSVAPKTNRQGRTSR